MCLPICPVLLCDEKPENLINELKTKNEIQITASNQLFPVFLKLEQLSVLIVGGGNVGLEKLNAILSNSPATKVRLVATSIREEVKELAANFPHVELFPRPFEG